MHIFLSKSQNRVSRYKIGRLSKNIQYPHFNNPQIKLERQSWALSQTNRYPPQLMFGGAAGRLPNSVHGRNVFAEIGRMKGVIEFEDGVYIRTIKCQLAEFASRPDAGKAALL